MVGHQRASPVTGSLFLVGAFAIAATVLSSTFDWPDILRDQPASYCLSSPTAAPA